MIHIVAEAVAIVMLFGSTPGVEAKKPEQPIKVEESGNLLPEIDRPQVIIEKPVVEEPVVEEPVVEEPVEEEPVIEKPVVEEPKKYSVMLGTYSTRYTGADTLNRNYNMRLAVNAINQVVLQPGQNFSYNDEVLKKSHNGKDYKMAGVLVNGKLDSGVGGGICQVSSTLYQASLYSGMTITKRQSHSIPVGYMPKGRDATVSWGSVDYKFRNDLKVPVKINAAMNYDTITIDFFVQKDPKLGKIDVKVVHGKNGYIIKRLHDGVLDYTDTSRYR